MCLSWFEDESFLFIFILCPLLFSHCLLVPFNCVSLFYRSISQSSDPLILVWADIIDEFCVIKGSVCHKLLKIHIVGSSVFIWSSVMSRIQSPICCHWVCPIPYPKEVWPPLTLSLQNGPAAVATFWSALCPHCRDGPCFIASPGIWLNPNNFWVGITLQSNSLLNEKTSPILLPLLPVGMFSSTLRRSFFRSLTEDHADTPALRIQSTMAEPFHMGAATGGDPLNDV